MKTTRIQHKGQVTIPTSIRREAGLSEGDLVDFAVKGGKIVITPQVVIDRTKFPAADDEYTPAQRRMIDREIAKSLKEARAGRIVGPFETAEEFTADLKKESAKLRAQQSNRPRT
jgi:AbrB family looped-hinge helix DNA binding protein